jgi:putative acetyltransferase
MVIRRERPDDVDVVQALTRGAFGRALEASLLRRLREDEGWLPALSLVAVDRAEVIGHVVCTRGRVGTRPALGLGPLSVRPDRQGGGVGHALMHAVLGAAEARDEDLVALLGEPTFYRRFGFVAATDIGVGAPEAAWGDYFQARVLGAPLTGPFEYAAPFAAL